MQKKYILFGAGEYGSRALKHYGAENVECFADNSISKTGSTYQDKTVISFERLVEIEKDYCIVITCRNYSLIKEMIKQLENAGINNFRMFILEREIFFKEILSYNLSEYKRLAIYSAGSSLSKHIARVIYKEFGERVICIAAEADSKIDKEYVDGLNVSVIDEVCPEIDALIISEEENHTAIWSILNKKHGRQFTVFDPFRKKAIFETNELVLYDFIHNSNPDESIYNETLKKNSLIKDINDYVDAVAYDVPLFEYIEVETINRCNGICTFCPVNKHTDPRELKHMETDLYESIVNQLSQMNYSGFFTPFSNNEPLLDERITYFVKYAKERLPNAYIYLYTNGTLLTMSKFKELVQYLDELVIDNYTQNHELIKPCKEIQKYSERHPDICRKVTIVLRKQDEILTSRGGDAPNRKQILAFENDKCSFPFRQLIIRPDGKVSLCCNDVYGAYTLGDLTKQSIIDVWYGDEYEKIRNAISKGRKHLEKCRRCDSFILM